LKPPTRGVQGEAISVSMTCVAAAALQEELTLEDANHRQLGRGLVERATAQR